MALQTYTRLSAIVSAIAADAGQNSATAPQTAFTAIGTVEAARREGPPRVVWVMGGGDITDPDQDESELSKIGYERQPECTVLFVGATYDAAENLMLDFLAAVRRTQQGTVIPTREEPTSETITGANRVGITVTLTVKLPVPFDMYTAADVDTASQTTTVNNPS
ncbi:MAG: hypothetical protein EKK62_03155 [Acidimicrobiia bacterium]|nr:MAG: hypothetical protein EKK62_03155 [Acidimicrobiia bacterium]